MAQSVLVTVAWIDAADSRGQKWGDPRPNEILGAYVRFCCEVGESLASFSAEEIDRATGLLGAGKDIVALRPQFLPEQNAVVATVAPAMSLVPVKDDEQVAALFELFWREYKPLKGKKGSKQEALGVWLKANFNVPQACWVAEAARRHAAAGWQNFSGYNPHAQRWLRRKMYLDDAEAIELKELPAAPQSLVDSLLLQIMEAK